MNTLAKPSPRTLLWAAIAALALLYVPFAAEYMLQYFSPEAPQWQNRVLGAMVSEDFARGPGSIASTQHDNFIQHRWAMLLHTVPGSLALLLCVVQFSSRLRQRHLGVHRAVGKLVFLLVLTSMLAGAAFLTQATPDQSRLGGIANTALLWGLDLTTLAATVLAYVAVRRRDISSHRAFVILMFTMLMTTPLLRYAWLVIAPFVPGADQLTVQNMAAIFLVVAAPAFAMVALALSDDFNRGSPALLLPAPIERWVSAILPAAALIGTAILYLRMHRLNTDYDTETFVAQLLPWALSWIVVETLQRRARHMGQLAAASRLRIFCWSIALVPVGLNIGWLLLNPFMSNTAEAYMTVAMTGAGGSMYAAYFLVVLQRASFWRGQVPRY